jgi:hypothetical protein
MLRTCVRSLGAFLVLAVLCLVRPVAVMAASDVEVLRDELQQTQAAFQHLLEMQQQTQRQLETLQQKIDSMETTRPPSLPSGPTVATPAQPPPVGQPASPALAAAATPTPPAAEPSPPPTTAQAPTPTSPDAGLPSIRELVSPREPFALYKERGQGQLLFDMGVTGDFVGAFTNTTVERAQAGTFPGFENRFFPREVEMSFFGQIDPYARGEVRIEGGEDFTNGSRNFNVQVAEANLTLQTLPFGTQAKLGLERVRFGLLNEVHEHDLPQVDKPDVLRNFLGPDGLVETGLEATWVPPTPFYLQILGGVFNGDNEVVAGWGRFSGPLATGRVRAFFETENYGALQLGVSGASGETPQQKRTALGDLEFKYKYTPAGWHHALATLAGEGLYFQKADATGQTEHRWGMYTYAEVQPWARWAVGLRGDWSQFPDAPGSEWALEPYVTFMPSEFLKFRLGYKYTDYSANSNFGKLTANEVLFQASFILGAHPAHPF